MSAGSMPHRSATDAPAFEVERFEWTAPDRIEVAGRWSGVRGRRFMRPTLDVGGVGGRRRLLAVLDHKPWAAEDGEPWIAAFAWDGERVAFDGAELAVAPSVAVPLPAPGGRAARFARPAPGPATARRPAASEPRGDARDADPRSIAALEAERDAAVRERDAAAREAAALRTELEAIPAHVGALQRERDDAVAARDAALRQAEDARARRESASGELRAEVARLSRQLAAARPSAEEAPSEARRGTVEALRAELERIRAERDIAVAERDAAVDEREVVRRERNALISDRDAALAARAAMQRERDAAIAARDTARAPARPVAVAPPAPGPPRPPAEPPPPDAEALERSRRRAARADPGVPGPGADRSEAEVWLVRVVAFGALSGILGLVVLFLQTVL